MTATQLAELLFFEPSRPPREADSLVFLMIVSRDELFARRLSHLISVSGIDGVHVDWVSDINYAESRVEAGLVDVVIVDEAIGVLPTFAVLHLANSTAEQAVILVGTRLMAGAAGRLCDPFDLDAYWNRERLHVAVISETLAPIVEARGAREPRGEQVA